MPKEQRTLPIEAQLISTLRKDKTMTNPDDTSPVQVSLRQLYETAKQSLAELEAIPPDAPGIDWAAVASRKRQLQAEIASFEQRFPDFKHSDTPDKAG